MPSKETKKRKKELEPVVLEVGEQLKKLRQSKSSSSEAWAYDTGINRVVAFRAESCSCNMTLGTLMKLLRAHGVTPKEFFSYNTKYEEYFKQDNKQE